MYIYLCWNKSPVHINYRIRASHLQQSPATMCKEPLSVLTVRRRPVKEAAVCAHKFLIPLHFCDTHTHSLSQIPRPPSVLCHKHTQEFLVPPQFCGPPASLCSAAWGQEGQARCRPSWHCVVLTGLCWNRTHGGT